MRGAIIAFVPLILWFCVTPALPADLEREVLAVSRALRHNRDLLKNVSAYTCLETISRQQKSPRERKPRTLDVVQVDVAVGQGREIYSWPGAATFTGSNLGGLVGNGFVATGFFDAFASNVFMKSVAAVNLAGTKAIQGTDALRFTYIFPSWANNWNINWLGAQGNVGTKGEFWVDRKSFTLLRLDAVATDIPPNLPLKMLKVIVDYKALSMGSKSTLIPSGAEILAVETNGVRSRDAISFSQCHMFTAESKIGPSPADLAKQVQVYEAHRIALPAGVNLPITLDTHIDTAAVKLGDPVRAHLDKTVRISPELSIPRGALVKGRIRESRELQNPPNTREIGFGFDEIDWPGHIGIFFAGPIQIEQLPGLSRFISRGKTMEMRAAMGLVMSSTTENIWAPQVPGVAIFFLSGSRIIPKGFRMTWRTHETSHP